uniref:Uncharacterized protein n=1 Tax=Astyanax mexicanus TaxID=7994 RepID=A0A3B1IW36_ASTMX
MGQQNNMILGSSAMGSGFVTGGAVCGMHNNLVTSGGLTLTANGISSGPVYGVQKNIVAPGISATTAAAPSSPVTTDDVFGKDYRFMLIEKDNVAVKKETERLIKSKDSGKHFTSTTSTSGPGSFSDDSLKREKKMVSSTIESTTVSSGQCRDLLHFAQLRTKYVFSIKIT